jgi:hypothetical protein
LSPGIIVTANVNLKKDLWEYNPAARQAIISKLSKVKGIDVARA